MFRLQLKLGYFNFFNYCCYVQNDLLKYPFNPVPDQNIDSVDLLSLISEEQIKLLIPAVGDQIRFKQAVKRINSNPCIDNNQVCIYIAVKHCRSKIVSIYYEAEQALNWLANSRSIN